MKTESLPKKSGSRDRLPTEIRQPNSVIEAVRSEAKNNILTPMKPFLDQPEKPTGFRTSFGCLNPTNSELIVVVEGFSTTQSVLRGRVQ